MVKGFKKNIQIYRNIEFSARNVLASDIVESERSLGCKFVNIDVSDRNMMREQTLEWNPTHILHFAQDRSFNIVKNDRTPPEEQVKVNIEGLKNVLDLASELKLKYLSHTFEGRMGYMETLRQADQICDDYRTKNQLDVRVLKIPFVIDYIKNENFHMPQDLIRCTIAEQTKFPMISMTDATDAMFNLIMANEKKLHKTVYSISGATYPFGDVAKGIRKMNYKFRHQFLLPSEISEQDRQMKQILESMPDSMDESESILDWSWQYKKPKKLQNFIENVYEKIIEFNN
ncbi:UNKNOWN [Stylonychia lemnae]|uniref:Nad-dependent epimerase dehydratase n=1 Tax=Stylonychia lemnae TaxID=5949 RepID=A0A078AEK4_STYLE|nr:UNKNOWN [Stylonychia lemnae]|eukprot:CDW80704.1 UNKNOWN [Stylonychia lemnae]